MKINLNKKQSTAIAIIVAIGILLAGLILLPGKNSSGEGDGHGHAGSHADTEHHADGKTEKKDHTDADKHADGEHHKESADKGKEDDNDKVVLTDAQIKAAGVSLQVADAAYIKTALVLPGEIQFNEDRTAHVVPSLAGIVQGVPANLGQAVKKGQVLAVISSTVLSEQRSELFAAQKRLALAKITFEREKKLWQEKISAEQDYLQAQQVLQETEIAVQNARQKLAAVGADTGKAGAFNRYEIRAPFDGIVVEKHISLGEAVREDTNVFTLSDLSTVWANIAVPAKDLNAVRVGEKVTVKASAFDSAATGTVAYVGSLLGVQTRTASARVTLANPQGTWRSGLFVNVEIVSNEVQVPVAVAVDALQTINDKPVIFVKVADGFVAQEVTTGRSDGKRIEIVKGLKAGSEYAASGSFVIKSELGKALSLIHI